MAHNLHPRHGRPHSQLASDFKSVLWLSSARQIKTCSGTWQHNNTLPLGAPSYHGWSMYTTPWFLQHLASTPLWHPWATSHPSSTSDKRRRGFLPIGQTILLLENLVTSRFQSPLLLSRLSRCVTELLCTSPLRCQELMIHICVIR